MKIKLIEIGKHKIEVIKLIRLFTGLSLKESKELADKPPSEFYVDKPELEFEQIKKNFDAIGAKIKKIEIVKKNKPIEKKVSNVPGEDLDEKILNPQKTIKAKKSKDIKKKVWEKPKFSENKEKSSFQEKKVLSIDDKLENMMFFKSVKSSLSIAVIGSPVSAFIFWYFRLPLFVSFLAIGIIIALTIKKTTGKTSRDLGILAAAFTLFSYIIYPFFSNILYAVLYNDLMYFHVPNIIFRFFSILYPSAFIPAIVAFFIASNAKLGEKLDSILKPNTTRKKSTFNSKSYKKGKRNIRRKKRKLD